MQEQATTTNQTSEISEPIPAQTDNQNQGVPLPQNLSIKLPKREHSVKNFISTLSNGAVIAGTGLGLFDHYGAQIAGTVCKGVGFGLNQICDGLKNHDTRNKIEAASNIFYDKRKTKIGGNNINLEPLTWKDKYGINQTKIDSAISIIGTLVNTFFQLLACGFLIGRFLNGTINQKDSKTNVNWITTTLTLCFATLAFIFDKCEQHIKQENLARYQAQLEKGIVELDKLPDNLQTVPRP